MDLSEEEQTKNVSENEQNEEAQAKNLRKQFLEQMALRAQELKKLAEKNPDPSMENMVNLLKEHQNRLNKQRGEAADVDFLPPDLTQEQILKRINPSYKKKERVAFQEPPLAFKLMNFVYHNKSNLLVIGGLSILASILFYYRYVHTGVALPTADLEVDFDLEK